MKAGYIYEGNKRLLFYVRKYPEEFCDSLRDRTGKDAPLTPLSSITEADVLEFLTRRR
jgi:hypothetical protein